MPPTSWGAIVLAGARSERLGGIDKAMIELSGITLLDRVLAATASADHVVVVGPQRTVAASVRWCEEDPPGGGPVPALAAGLAVAPPSGIVVLLASDLPFIGEGVEALVAALDSAADVAVLVDADGRANYLASAWRRNQLEAALTRIGDPTGQSMRRLLNGMTVAEVRDTGGWGEDCDTWEALDRARERGVPDSDE
ncbi:MAG: molybdenum cofactor guanylyltransferase [Marmoricola sp.]